MKLERVAYDGSARTGEAEIRGRRFRTPAFMPVGTAGTVKGLSPDDLGRLGVEIALANTYHLRLRPHHERVREFGGLHRFMGFSGALLTDSGGYQIFSLTSNVRLDEDGATLRSPYDGEAVRLTPETAVEIQAALDSDIAMVLDHPVALPAGAPAVLAAAERTLRWAERSLAHHRRSVRSGQALFGIVQGALDVDLRQRQAERLIALGFDGYAVGGLAVGETKEQLGAAMQAGLQALPRDQPRYVMGVGYPEDILAGIAHGADMFDCVLPTRHARTGQAFTSRGVVKLKNSRWRTTRTPLDPECACETCRTFETCYLAHLYHADEMLGPILVARHNVHFYQRLVRGAGEAIREGRFAAYRAAFLARAGSASSSERAGPAEAAP